MRILKCCPPCIWRLHCLLELLHLSEPCFQLIECFKTILVVLGPDCVRGEVTKFVSHTSAASDRLSLAIKGGKKRHIDESTHKSKRQKAGADILPGDYFVPVVDDENDGKDSASLHGMLMSAIESLKPPPAGRDLLGPGISIVALSMLTNAFFLCSSTGITSQLIHQMFAWIPWIAEQVPKNSIIY